MDELARLERALAETETMWRRERQRAEKYREALDKIQNGCRRMTQEAVHGIAFNALEES